MKISNIFFALITLLMLGATSLFAQQESGQIHGAVVDSLTGEVLPGANVLLVGTSMGCSTDVDGNYVIYGVPSGSYKLSVRYIGYKGREVSIEVRPGAMLQHNFLLLSQAVEGQEVIVTAQAQGQKAAINQQLASNTISNVVSSEKIQKLPDENAATAMSRLPGVSLMNGDQVVIRGAQAKLNEILLNGVQLPSTGMNDRATDLGFISSNMLSSIQVTKVLTPDMDANAIGGVVNLKLRQAPEDFHLDVLSQGNYNGADHTSDNYKDWISVSDRFFDNKLGVFVQGNADQSDVGDWKGNASYGFVGDPNTGYYNMNSYTYESDKDIYTNTGGTLILDYRLPHGKLVFQNSYANSVSDISNYQNVFSFAPSSINYTMLRQQYGKDLMINSFDAENSFGDVQVDLTYSHSFGDQYSTLGYGGATAYTTTNFGFTNPANQSYVDASGQVVSYQNQVSTITPGDVNAIRINPADQAGAYVSGWWGDDYPRFRENLNNGSLDISVPVDFSNTVRSTFKVGGKVYQTARSNATTELFCSESINDSYGAIKNIIPGVTLSPTRPLYFNDVWNQNYLSQRGKYFLNGSYPFSAAFSGLMDQVMLLAPAGWAHSEYEPGEWDRTWDGTETFGAGYAMGTFEIGPQLNLIAGVRYEHYNMNYSANNTYVTHEVYGDGLKLDTLNTVNRNDDDFFPNAQLRYKINEWSDIRVAFSKGISRPDYTAIIPETYFAPGADAHAGNAQLKPDISTNYDIAWSVYNNQVGLFTIAPFYKEIDNIFYYNPIIYQDLSKYNVSFPDSAFWAKEGLQAPSPSMQISAYVNNPHPAYVRGIELDWQTNFWYLPGVLSAVVLDVNYTKAASNMLYQEEDNEYHNIDTVINGHSQTIQQWYVVDTTRNGRLLYQANDVVNVALGIDYKGFSGRLSFNMQGNVITNVGLSDQEDQYTGNIYKWDFLLQQKLPLEGLSLSLSGVNIFHNPIYTYQYLRRVNASAPLVKNVVSVDYSPSLFELNLRYSL